MSGKQARAQRQTSPHGANELRALALLFQWDILPAGICAHCHTRHEERRTLLSIMGPVPTQDKSDAEGDADFCRLAEAQRQGEYAIGAVFALCRSCAYNNLAAIPDRPGIVAALLRHVVPTPGTDAVMVHGEPGTDKLLGWSVLSGTAGAVMPQLESACERLAAERLQHTPRVVFEWDGAQ